MGAGAGMFAAARRVVKCGVAATECDGLGGRRHAPAHLVTEAGRNRPRLGG